MLKSLLPALFWATIILFLSAHPQMGIPHPIWVIQPDKIAHAGAYALLAFLLYYAFRQPLMPVILGTVYGICIEFMQSRIRRAYICCIRWAGHRYLQTNYNSGESGLF